MRLPSFLLVILLLTGCYETPNSNNPTSKAIPTQTTIKVQPLGRVDAKYVQEAVAALKQFSGNVVLLPQEALPKHAFYASRNRYRADILIKWMSAKAESSEVYVGITEVDISTTKGDVKDFGVMGLAFMPGKACVVSPFRLKDRKHFYKLVLHEAAHTAGLPHCPEKTCYLRDAKGGDHTAEQTDFCDACKRKLKASKFYPVDPLL